MLLEILHQLAELADRFLQVGFLPDDFQFMPPSNEFQGGVFAPKDIEIGIVHSKKIDDVRVGDGDDQFFQWDKIQCGKRRYEATAFHLQADHLNSIVRTIA